MAKSGNAAVYNRILREFTKINNDLPEDRKLSLADRRKIISEKIYPNYKGQAKSKFRVKPLKKTINGIVDKIPPKETCDPNYIDPSVYRTIDVFGIDEHLQSVIPACIYVQVNGGEFGETRIFNTRNYSYERSGVKGIIEAIREGMANRDIPSELDWAGYQKLRPKKPNNGVGENYYIEYILNINGTPQGDTTTTRLKLPKGEKPKKTKVTNIILERISKVRAKKKKAARVKKSTSQAQKAVSIILKKQKKLKTSEARVKYEKAARDIYFKQLKKLQKSLESGVLSKEDYLKQLDKLSSKFNGGGTI